MPRLATRVIDRLPLSARRAARSPEAVRAYDALLRLNGTLRHYVGAVAPCHSARAALREFPRYLHDRRRYIELSGERLDRYDDNPQLFDRTGRSPFDPHYTYQDAWAARQVAELRPRRHVDVGSRITFATGLAPFVPVTFVDLRPLEIDIPGLECRQGNLLDLDYDDQSIESLSCLHVIEHVGLGRYGDQLAPDGTRRAAAELARVLAPAGRLLVGLPVGRQRTNFNAHRVHDPAQVAPMFVGLELEAFAGVDDEGRFHASLEPADLSGCDWGCGLYRFRRPSSPDSRPGADWGSEAGAGSTPSAARP